MLLRLKADVFVVNTIGWKWILERSSDDFGVSDDEIVILLWNSRE